MQLGQKLGGDRPMHQAHFLGVAHAGAAGFGVFNDGKRHVLIGGGIHIHMANAGAGLNAGHPGVFHTGADQPCAAAGDQQIHKAHGGHQLGSALAGGVLHQLDILRGKAAAAQSLLQHIHNGVGAVPCLLAAAQNAHIAAFQRQSGGIAGHIGAAFVNDGHHAHGHGGFFDQQAAGGGVGGQRLAHRVRQGGHLPNALRHGGNACRGEQQAVQHHLADMPAGGVHVLRVGFQNHILLCHQQVGHGQQCLIFGIGGQRQGQRNGLGGL